MKITRKEAVDALKKRISPYTNCAADAEANEVIRMAIKALKQGDALNKIRAEINQITDTMGVSYNQYVSKIDVLKIIDNYKAKLEVIE